MHAPINFCPNLRRIHYGNRTYIYMTIELTREISRADFHYNKCGAFIWWRDTIASSLGAVVDNFSWRCPLFVIFSWERLLSIFVKILNTTSTAHVVWAMMKSFSMRCHQYGTFHLTFNHASTISDLWKHSLDWRSNFKFIHFNFIREVKSCTSYMKEDSYQGAGSWSDITSLKYVDNRVDNCCTSSVN